MRFRTPTAIAVAASAAFLLAACSGTSGSTGPEMSTMTPSTPPSAAASTATTSAAAGSFAAQDVTFAQMMAAHHLQAVEMADMLLQKTGVDSRVSALASAIKGEQQPEITRMNGWLTAWGSKPVTSSMNGSSMTDGGGMMSTADMDALANASGAKASRLFLTQMITHHTGAIAMAKTEITSGKSIEAVALANSITTSQTGEIATMQKLLTSL